MTVSFVCTNAGRRVVGFGVREDGGEFSPEEFGDVVSGAEHGRTDGRRSHGELHCHMEYIYPGGKICPLNNVLSGCFTTQPVV